MGDIPDIIEATKQFDIIGIIEKENSSNHILGYPIIGVEDDIVNLSDKIDFFFITIGQILSSNTRKRLYNMLEQNNLKIATIISPHAIVSSHAFIEKGSIIMHDVIINAGSIVGKNCIINTKALIEHDVIVGDNCHISTAAVLNGGVKVGDNSFIGSGSITKQYISIPENSFIKANSIVK